MQKIHIKINKDELYLFLVSAVRYALGCRTYIVSWTCKIVRKYKSYLTDSELQVLIRNIKEQEKWGYGMDCDRQDWIKLVNDLEMFIKEKV